MMPQSSTLMMDIKNIAALIEGQHARLPIHRGWIDRVNKMVFLRFDKDN